MCSCPEESKIKFAACTFTERALTWWNGHVTSLFLVTANAMGWDTLKDLLRREYYPRGEIQKLEEELWNLKMKGTDITAYTARFCDLAAICPNMIPTVKVCGSRGGCFASKLLLCQKVVAPKACCAKDLRRIMAQEEKKCAAQEE